jgi:LPS export ABC transporter protein LptC
VSTGRRLSLTPLLAGVLAVAWACGDGSRPTATLTPADTADQVLVSMTHFVTVDGVQRAKVTADTAYFYSPTQTAELRHLRITFYDKQGAETTNLTAHEGTYYWRTGDMEGRGEVRAVTTDGRRLNTAVLRYSQTRNQVSSDSAFVFDGPDRHIEGEGFTSNPEFTDLVATRPTGTGGRFTLPSR